MTTLSIELPEDIIAQAKADTGKRTARTAVLAALKAYHEEHKYEPPTPEQCARQMRKRGRMPLAPELIALGAGKDFLKR